MKFRSLAPLAIILLSFSANAKVFRNAYISFELPDTWKCNLEQTEWVCRSEQTKESKEAIIILTAKEVGPTDSYPLYQAHLDSPISVTFKGGGGTVSKVVYKSKQENINDQMWVDSLHMNSEVPNYFTRYVATIKNKIAILVTFSAHKQYYTKYSQDFFKAIQSLRVIASPTLGNGNNPGQVRPGSETFGYGSGQGMPGDMYQEQSTGGKSNKMLMLLGALVLAVLGAVIFIRSKKNKRK
ncbi:LPXTG cell wall anchor domain-containing protein [Bdellovibrio sp. HCB185ZH]|uniref:LPXTG cell wall anchor domain-containing protein n=1 Tax=Bdellovibrio sp. HCB185ZH TaxID=3394235 RepID=UPI0039A6876A